LLGIVIAIGVISAVVWSARYAPWIERRGPAEGRIERKLREAKETAAEIAGKASEQGSDKSTDQATDAERAVEAAPPVAAKPPFPKVETGRSTYSFGRMLVNDEARHTFRIENKGEGTLVIAKGPTECICTVSKLSNHEIPPGGFAEVELRWRPPAADSEFSKSAIFWTNDPKRPQVRFTVAGRVAPLAVIMPARWNAGTVTDEHEGKAVGTITSEVDDHFQIVKVEPADPNVRVDFKPIAKEELQRARVRGGYEFTATVGKGIHLGHWRSLLRIQTTLERSRELDVELTALRTGPIMFLPAVPIVGIAFWNSDKLLLNLGRFPRASGTKAAVPAVVYAMTGKFEMLGVKSNDSIVKVSVEPDPKIATGERQQVRFVFEVPPGSPSVTRLARNPVHITVDTNHPTLKQIDFNLEFVSR
jgi:hypothetical protein